MQQPRKPNQISSSSPSMTPMQQPEEEKKKRPLPTPQELISQYESQGMDSQQASFKVIDDLQNMLVRVISSSSSSSKSVKAKKNKFMSEASRKLDTVNARLTILEMKLDSKPGYPQSLAIGVASAATFRGLSSVWPHVATAALHIWNSVRGATKPSV